VFDLDTIVTYLKPDISRLKFRSLTAGLQVAVATAFCKVVLILVGHFMVLAKEQLNKKQRF
jgi:hypothetical protein